MNTTTQKYKYTHPERPLINVPTQVPDDQMPEEDSIGDAGREILGLLAPGGGYLGSLCLFIGGLATFLSVPFIGQIGYLNGPTGSGVLFILCATLSVYITYTRRFFLLYLTGGIAGLMAASDILNATRLGYVVQMALGGGLTASMGGTQDPVVAQMMENTGFSIPAGWIILAAGIGILLMTPGLVRQEEPPEKQGTGAGSSVKAVRMKELENLITMYERGLITREEYQELKREIIGKK